VGVHLSGSAPISDVSRGTKGRLNLSWTRRYVLHSKRIRAGHILCPGFNTSSIPIIILPQTDSIDAEAIGYITLPKHCMQAKLEVSTFYIYLGVDIGEENNPQIHS
jgi:hypothetical protein